MRKRFTKNMLPVVACGVMAVNMLAPAMPAFAADAAAATDTAEATVGGVEEKATVKAYRIVTATYANGVFNEFTTIPGVTIADITKPTAAEVAKIAQDIKAGTITPDAVTLTGTGTTFKGDLAAGQYIVLVENQANASVIYNPMIVSAAYGDVSDGDTLKAGTVDATGKFLEGATEMYVKSTTIDLDKTILDEDGKYGVDDNKAAFPDDAKVQGNDLGVGDTGHFQITTKIPAYSAAYKNVTYTLTDKQDAGFDPVSNVVVTVGGATFVAGDETFSLNTAANVDQGDVANDFIINFNSDFILKHPGEKVVVTYEAKLNDKAVQKLDPNNDTAELEYTNDLFEHTTKLTDDVQEYTFPIQVKKTNEEGTALAGAEFELTKPNGTKVTVVSGQDGKMQFDRLDEGTYTLVETKAPAGFHKTNDVFEIVITPTYNDADGKIKDYTVKMKNTTKNVEVGEITIDNPDDDILAGNITNTQLQELPSTGGQGRKVAVALAAGMAGLTACVYVYGRKKENDAE